MNPKLLMIFNQLNEAKLLYGLGGSMMLKLRSFELQPHDVDLFVSIDDYNQVINIFKDHATQVVTHSKTPFKTKHFTSFKCEDITIDIISGFAHEHLEGTYTALFDHLSIPDWIRIGSVEIPLMSLEEWFVLYSIMNRSDKVDMIETIWKKQGVEYPNLLERQLLLQITYSIKAKVLTYLAKK